MNTRERVILSAHLLIAIERERKSRDAPGVFNSVEREIISRELNDLETEWSTNDPDRCFVRVASAVRRWSAPKNDDPNRRA
jgi:hypothetical protein